MNQSPRRQAGDAATEGRGKSGSGTSQVVLIALAAMLLTVRELAARACADGLPAAVPVSEPVLPAGKGWFSGLVSRFSRPVAEVPAVPVPSQRQLAFETRLENNLKKFIARSVLPEQGHDILAWLITPDRTGRGLTTLPKGLDAEALTCLEMAWHEVLGTPFREFLSDGRIIAGEEVSTAGISPMMSQVSPDGNAERVPGSAGVRLPLRALHSKTPVEHWDESVPALSPGYASLWEELLEASSRLARPQDHELRRWLDDFDSMLSTVLYAVPASINQDIAVDSLVESARFSAACAVSKWLRKRDGNPKDSDYLVVVGEFSPIQDFLFNIDRNNPWPGEAVLRGRSAFIKLTVELAALRILEQLDLPSVCLSFCAASKFSMLVSNTDPIREGLKELQQDFDNWSRDNLHGTGRMLLNWEKNWKKGTVRPAPDKSRIDLVQCYQDALDLLDKAKFRRSELTRKESSPILTRYLDEMERADGLCSLDGKSPAYSALGRRQMKLLAAASQDEPPLGEASWFQLMLANELGRTQFIAIGDQQLQPNWQIQRPHPAPGNFVFFDYTIRLISSTRNDAGADAVRSWDVSYALRDSWNQKFNGNAIRLVSMHSPAVGNAAGHVAVLKGDIDRLGTVFKKGIHEASLVRISMLSRQLELFFSLYVPALLKREFPLVQTIVAGGDDFMFMGPVAEILQLTTVLHLQFAQFAANTSMSFSAGMAVGARQGSIQDLGKLAELALEAAKVQRNSICAHGRAVTWTAWYGLRRLEADLQRCFDSLVSAFADGQMDKRRSLLLHFVIQLMQDWNEPRNYTGLRWRPVLHARLQAWCRALPYQTGTGKQPSQTEQRAVFEALVDLLDTRGLAVFGPDLLIPVGNLILRERNASPNQHAANGAEASGPAAPATDGARNGLHAHFPESWLEMGADHFGLVAENLAIALFKLEKKRQNRVWTGLLAILEDLREWDGHANGHDDVFTLLRPIVVAMVSRARSKGDRIPLCILDLRLHLSQTVNSAATLSAARWFVESVLVYYDIRRKLYF